MTEPREVLPEELARRAAAAGSMDALKASGAFDELMAQIDSGQLELDGKDGFIQQLIKASLERGLQAELSGHLGYDKGDPVGRFLPNARNGSYAKTLGTSAGDVDLAVPRDRKAPLLRVWSRRVRAGPAGSQLTSPSQYVAIPNRLPMLSAVRVAATIT
jgi:putative transposase